jgi:hypothetical protein
MTSPATQRLRTTILETAGLDVLDELGGLWLLELHHRRIALRQGRPQGPASATHYLTFVRGLPCAFCQRPGPSEPHHFGRRGVGQKTDDYRTVPACRTCHDAKHDKVLDPVTRLRVMQALVDTLVLYMRTVEQR